MKTGRRVDMKKLIVALLNFANEPKNSLLAVIITILAFPCSICPQYSLPQDHTDLLCISRPTVPLHNFFSDAIFVLVF